MEAVDSAVDEVVSVFGTLWNQLANFLPSLLGAIAILILGWLFASAVAVLVKRLFKQTKIDNRIGAWLMGQDQGSQLPHTERWIAATVYWVIMVFVVVAFLNALQLEAVSQPLNDFLEQIFRYLPRIGGAALLLLVAWAVATIAKVALTHGLQRFKLDDQLAQQMRDPNPDPEAAASSQAVGASDPANEGGPFLLNETLGNALYWFVLLFFLPLVLDTLNLQGPLEPVQNLLDQLLSVLPRVLGAVIIGAVGWLLARIVRGIVTNLLAAAGLDRMGSRMNIPQASQIAGTVVYVLVLIPTVIAALNALEIRAISEPAVAMLEQVLTVIPQVIGAGLILGLFYLIGRFLSELVVQVLQATGFDNIFMWLGLPALPVETGDPATQTQLSPRRSPSSIVGIVVLVGIVLFGAVPAAELLQFPTLTDIVRAILRISAQVLSGILVFGIGLYLANLAFSLITSFGGQQSRLLGQIARVSILTLVGAMALQQMGVATDIVVLAFGLVLGAIAVAVALAFGLGGRDVAAEQVRRWLQMFDQDPHH